MKQETHSLARAALTLSAAALLATPALAQDAPVAAPPVQAAPAVPVAEVAPPPVVRTVREAPSPATAALGVKVGTSSTPVDPQAAAEAAANDAARATTHHAVRTGSRFAAVRAARPVTPPVASAPATTPVAAAPVAPSPAPVPVATAPASDTAAVQPSPAPAVQPPAAQTSAAPTTAAHTTATTTRSTPVWPWVLLVALLAVAAAGVALWRRRAVRETDDWSATEPAYVDEPAVMESTPVAAAPLAAVEPTYLEPAPVAVAPVTIESEATVAAPAVAEDATVVAADADEVAALTEATAPVADRPWLEFAMRPVRAGTNVDEALVEIELTVGNAGSVAAQDVRITTFMLPAGSDDEMERLLVDTPVDASVAPVTLDPGEGTRVDATLALSRAELLGAGSDGPQHTSFHPVVVADARYRLADGSEGRTSASFLIGGTPESGDTLMAFELGRAMMRDDVEARLYRAPRHS